MDIQLVPGSTGAAVLAYSLFEGRTQPGAWMEPVKVRDVDWGEFVTFYELLQEEYDGVQNQPHIRLPSGLLVGKSLHRMNSVELRGAPVVVCQVVQRLMAHQDYGYKLPRDRAGAFLQGYEPVDGWALVEFWEDDFWPFVKILHETISRENVR